MLRRLTVHFFTLVAVVRHKSAKCRVKKKTAQEDNQLAEALGLLANRMLLLAPTQPFKTAQLNGQEKWSSL